LSQAVGLWYNARRAIRAAGVVLLGMVGSTSAQAQIAQLKRIVPQPEFATLTFDGNANLSSTELEAAMASESSHCRFWPVCRFWHSNFVYKKNFLDRAELDRDLLRLRVLYWKRGWRASQITPDITKLDEGVVAVTLRIVEGPPTLIGTLDLGHLDSLLNAHGIRKLVDVKPGQTLDLIHLDTIATRIAGHLDEEGFGDLTVNPVAVADTSSPKAAVSFDVKGLYETRVESVRVEGTEKFDPRVVANTMGIKAGDRYSRIALIESQRALYGAGFFKRAFVRAAPGSTDSLKKLIAQVEELPARSFRVTGGLSTVDFFQLDGRYTDANFGGNAARLSLQATVGNVLGAQLNGFGPFKNVLPDALDPDSPKFLQPTFQVNADLRRRWLSDFRNQTGFSVFGYRRSSPGVFVDQGGGAGASFTRNVTRTVPVSLQYRMEFTNVSAADPYYCVNFGVCDEASLVVIRKTQRLAPLNLTISTDRRDDPIGPTRGYTWRADLEFATKYTGSQFGYARAEVEGSKYFHMNEKVTVAIHGRAGYIRGELAQGDTVPIILPRKRFYAGGARSVRGYGENQLGPRVLVIPRSVFQPTQAGFDSLLANPKNHLPCAPNIDLPLCPTDSLSAPRYNGRYTSAFLDGNFTPKPLGASALVEASIEVRYHIGGPFTLAAFVDAGSVGAKFGGTATVFTPGIGVRYLSPVGPIRMDIGYNPRPNELLSVVTELSQPRDSTWLRQVGMARGIMNTDTDKALDRFTTQTGLFQIGTQRSFNPANGTGFGGNLNRITLHLSIGEAF
jgi:outer membrane protein insertion porin family/translocation and assembly module TamA